METIFACNHLLAKAELSTTRKKGRRLGSLLPETNVDLGTLSIHRYRTAGPRNSLRYNGIALLPQAPPRLESISARS